MGRDPGGGEYEFDALHQVDREATGVKTNSLLSCSAYYERNERWHEYKIAPISRER